MQSVLKAEAGKMAPWGSKSCESRKRAWSTLLKEEWVRGVSIAPMPGHWDRRMAGQSSRIDELQVQ